jgi:hypothetical protein
MRYYVYEGGIDQKGRQRFELDFTFSDREQALERCEDIAKRSQIGGYVEAIGYKEHLWIDKGDRVILSKLIEQNP